MKKFGSILYKPKKPYHKMTIKDLCDHNKICRSLDKMNYKKIQRLEKLKPDILERKIKRFLHRNNNKKTKKRDPQDLKDLKKSKKRKKQNKKGGMSRKQKKKLFKKSIKSNEIL